jgi:hypothetical protein
VKLPVVIKSPIDVVVKFIYKKDEKTKKDKGGYPKSGKRGRPKKIQDPPFFTDEDLMRKAGKSERKLIPPKDLFNFIDALDAYEIDKKLEETLVVDITEITNDGLVVIHIEPKKMIRYVDVYEHIDAMMVNAFKNAKMKDYEYEIKKILFRIHKTGVPSSVVDDLKELKNKVEELWEHEFGDEMKSYV